MKGILSLAVVALAMQLGAWGGDLIISSPVAAPQTPAPGQNTVVTSTGRITGTARGIDASAAGAGVSITLDAGAPLPQIEITGDDLAGIYMGSNQTATNNGTIKVTGTHSHAIEGVGSNTVTNAGTLQTSGTDAYAIRMTGDGCNITNSGLITTTGKHALGINMGANNSWVTNTGTGTITTTGDDAAGIDCQGWSGNTIVNAGTISTSGGPLVQGAYGIWIGDTSTAGNSGSISTQGTSADGIHCERSGNTVTNEATGTITTLGTNARGIWAPDGNTVINHGTITTQGAGGHAIEVGNNSTVTNTGSLQTDGDNACGIDGGTNNQIANSGDITTSGANSHGIHVGTGSINSITNTGTIEVSGDGAAGIMLDTAEIGNFVVQDGTARATGDGGAGILVLSSNNTINHSGTTTILGVGGAVVAGEGAAVPAAIRFGYMNGNGIEAVGPEVPVVGGNTLNILGGSVIVGDCLNAMPTTLVYFNLLDTYFEYSYNFTGSTPWIGNVLSGSVFLHGDDNRFYSLTVGPDGGLGGTGTVIGDVTNDGILFPGASAGILSGSNGFELGEFDVEGSYTQNAGGQMQIGIQYNSPLQVGRLNVTNEAALSGALVPVVLGHMPAGEYGPVTIVEAGEITEEFDELIDNYALYDFSVGYLYPNDSAVLYITRYPYDSFARTHNQRQLGRSLEAVLGTSGEGSLGSLLDLLDASATGDAICYALDRLNPEPYHALEDIVFGNAQQVMGQMFHNLRTVKYGLPGQNIASVFATVGPKYADAGQGNPAARTGAPAAKATALLDPDRRWNFLAFGYGHFVDIDSEMSGPDILRTGLRFTSAGGMVGFDYRFNDTMNIGLVAGAGMTDGEWDLDRGEVDATSVWAGPYFSYADKGWFADASVLYGHHWFDTSRRAVFPGWHEVLEAEPRADSVTAYAGGGYMHKTGKWSIGPIASLQYTWVGIDSFKEKDGDAALELKDRDPDSLRTLLGGRAAYEESFAWGKLIPEVNVRWACEVLARRGEMTARFVNSGAPAFHDRMETLSRHSAYLGAGLNALIKERLSTYVNYDAEVGGDQTVHSVRAGVSIKF